MSKQVVKKTEESYNEVPYESFAYPKTHPSYVGAVASLFGLAPADLKTARVLEIGCAGGGNLFPQALEHPKASFTGIDLSGEQIAVANKQKEAMGLKNIEFRQQDIMALDLKKEKEKYDYIICHGVFSWVPEEVRKKILDFCSAALSPKGVAVISYNTLPGWNAVRSVREMMLYHTNRFTKPEDKIKQSRALLEFLIENVPPGNVFYRGILNYERNLLVGLNDTYLYHDHLAGVNTQFYFDDFARMAREHGLNYVGDADVFTMYLGNMPQKAKAMLQTVDDVIAQEQYMDFITNRRFRTSILCRQDQSIVRTLRGDKILNYALSAVFQPIDANADLTKSVSFRSVNGNQFQTHEPVSSAVFLELALSGSKPISVEDLVARACKRLGKTADAAAVRAALVKSGLELVMHGYIALHANVPHSVQEISKKPVAWPLARYQAGLPNCKVLTNILNLSIRSDEVANIVIAALDGTKDVAALVDILSASIDKGLINIAKDGKPLKDKAEIKVELEKTVQNLLPKLANQYLLVG